MLALPLDKKAKPNFRHMNENFEPNRLNAGSHPELKTDHRPDVKVPLVNRYTSSQLFGDKSEIEIEHEGAVYRLRLTKFGKLVLNK